MTTALSSSLIPPKYKYRAYAVFDEEVFSELSRPSWLSGNDADIIAIWDLMTDKALFSAASVDELKLKAAVAGISDEEVDPVVHEYDSGAINWRPSSVRYC